MMIISTWKINLWAGLAAALAIIAVAVMWLPDRFYPSDAAIAASEDVIPDSVDRYFQQLGIIKLHRIPPPMDPVLADLTGRRVRLSDFSGKVVFLNFWTTWCPECRIEMPALEKLYRHFKDRGLIMLAVSLRESKSKVAKFMQREKLTFPALLDSDGRVGRRFGIRSIPTTILIDQEGAMVGKAIGSREWDSSAAMALFEHLITHPPAPRRSRE
jgi:peroxiredoxin